MSALALAAEYPMREPNKKWTSMDPDDRKKYSARLREKAIQLMTARADSQGLQGADIQERTGYTTSWVSKVNTGKATTFEALCAYATSTGYPLSFFVALAEDLIEAEDKRFAALDSSDIDQD